MRRWAVRVRIPLWVHEMQEIPSVQMQVQRM
jgi:hypothetical protein